MLRFREELEYLAETNNVPVRFVGMVGGLMIEGEAGHVLHCMLSSDAMKPALLVWSVGALVAWLLPWWRLRFRSWSRLAQHVFDRLRDDPNPNVQRVIEAGWYATAFAVVRLFCSLVWPYAVARYWVARGFVFVRALRVRRLRGRPFSEGASR